MRDASSRVGSYFALCVYGPYEWRISETQPVGAQCSALLISFSALSFSALEPRGSLVVISLASALTDC